MTPSLALITTDEPLFRVARAPDPWAWPSWPYAHDDGTFGGRFDDPRGEYRVLYASSQREGAFAETLARYRRDVHVEAELRLISGGADDEQFPELVAAATVPKEWLESRLLGTAGHRGAFVDLGHSDSLAHLRSVLASRVVHYGLDDLDAGAIRRAPRAFTQEISRYVFEHARTATGEPVSSIRYRSRLGDEFVNWAIFESSPPADPRSGAIDLADDALESIFRRFELAWG